MSLRPFNASRSRSSRSLRAAVFALATLVLSLQIAELQHDLWHVIHGDDDVCTVCLQLNATALPAVAVVVALAILPAALAPFFGNPLKPRRRVWRALCRDPPFLLHLKS